MQIKQRSDQFWLSVLLTVLGIIYVSHALYYPSSYEGADGLRHYLISRYSWKHPELFLYSWGKPFFTLVSSPFSQFGLFGLKVFNILCALLTGILVFRIARKLEIPHPVLAVFFMGFAPIYFFCTNSGYTELFFGLLLSWSTWKYINRNYLWSTVLISFLPFVRSEGYLLLGLFFLVLVLRRKWKFIPLLAVGNILYSVVGYFHYHSLTWLITENPYDGRQAAIYGHGPLLHFVYAYWVIFGKPLVIFVAAGLVYPLVRFIRKRKDPAAFSTEEIILIYGSFLLYFVAHSIFWWKGLFNSLGLERVMAAIIPAIGIICLRGWQWLNSLWPSFTRIRSGVLVLLLVLAVFYPFHSKMFPLRLDQEELLIKEASDWYDHSPLKGGNHQVYYLHPFIPLVLDIDPFDSKKVSELWGLYPTIRTYGYSAIPEGTLIFWDAHFGPNEGLAPLDTMLHDAHFNLVKFFGSENAKIVLGGRPFEIYLFQKTDQPTAAQSLDKRLFDFESDSNLENIASLTNELAFSGQRCTKLSATAEYSAGILQPVSALKLNIPVSRIHFSCRVNSRSEVDALAVLSSHTDGKQADWKSFPVHISTSDAGKWILCEGDWLVDPAVIRNANQLKMYIWNKSKQEFYCDDLEFSLYDR